MAAATQDSPENRPVKHQVDTFSSIAQKYEFVFGLSKESRILLLGPYYQAISQDLRQHFVTVHFAACASEVCLLVADNSYDLVCLDAYSNWTERRVEKLIIMAKSYLARQGTLLVAATNSASLDRILSKLRRRAVGVMRGLTPGGYRKALRSAGFFRTTEFMVFPSLRTADEYVTTAHGDVELPVYVSILHKLFHRLRLFKHVHADFLYIATTDAAGGLDAFTIRIDKQLAESGLAYDPLYLERFDMRERGALMLMLSDRGKKHRVVARVAVSDEVNTVIARNSSFTDRIHSLTSLDTYILRLVPRTIAVFKYRDCFVYVENRIPGVLVWKVSANQRVEKRAYTQSYDFISAFNTATATERYVDSVLFDELIGHDLMTIESGMDGAEGVHDTLRNIGSHLRKYYSSRTISTVWGHGDFGYGNILCNPSTGDIQGVIDWDTHVENELPGVDFCNLLLQKTSTDFDGNVATAMKILSQTIKRNGTLDTSLPQYGKGKFQLSAIDYEICLCLAGLRMIKRSIPYRKEFLLRKSGYLEILAIAQDILTGAMEMSSPSQGVIN